MVLIKIIKSYYLPAQLISDWIGNGESKSGDVAFNSLQLARDQFFASLFPQSGKKLAKKIKIRQLVKCWIAVEVYRSGSRQYHVAL